MKVSAAMRIYTKTYRLALKYLQQAARELGLAARERYYHKLTKQYPHREPGAALFPLIIGEGGRWHEVAERVFRSLSKDSVKGG